MDKEICVLFALIRSTICGVLLSDKEKALYDPEMLPQLIKIAKHHDIIHLLACGLKKNDLLDESSKELEKTILLATYRYVQINYAFTTLCEALEKAQISFIPLKGSVIRQYYPEPWMRTSCDIDVLVHETDLEKAVAYLVENLGYTYSHKFTHDVSLFTENGIHIELHYSLMDDEPVKSSYEVLHNVWDKAVLKEGNQYWYELPDEVFYFYHIAHMAKHFENGGCGIRALIDIHVLNHRVHFDGTRRMSLLEHGDLLLFANQANLLAEVWFGKAKHTPATLKMEDFIVRGGVYGSTENHIAIQQYKKGGKFRYALSKIWLPYDMIKFYYPILGKYKIFTPLMELRRWMRLLFDGQLKRATKELDYNSRIAKNQMQETRQFLQDIGL